MKNTGKTSKPIIAANSTKQNGKKPAPPAKGTSAGTKARVSRVSSEKMRCLVMERISDGILAFDTQMNHVYVDEKAGELLGREPKQLVGKNFWEEYPNSSGTPFADACQRAFATQTVVPFDGYFHPTNSWFEGRVYPSSDGLSVLISEHGLPDPEEMIQALEKSEEKFSKAFHSSPVAKVIIRARDQYIIDTNQSFLKLFDFQREEVVGRTSREMSMNVSPIGREEILQLWQQKGSIHQQELDVQIRSGKVFHILLSAEQIELENEPCALISALDITARKQAEERVRELSEFPMQNPNPIMRFTREAELVFANPSATLLLGRWEQRDGKPVLPAELRGILNEVITTDSNRQIEIDDGSKTYTCLFVPVPHMGYVNLYFSDITERKLAEESLQALIHQASTGITRLSLDGRYLFANQAFCDMVGYSEAELKGKTIWELSYKDDISRNRQMFERMAAEGEAYQLEKRLIRRNGTVLWANVGTSPLRDTKGQAHSAVSVIVDITRRKRAEESLLNSARRTLYISTLNDALRSLVNPQQIEDEATNILGSHLKASRVAYARILDDGRAVVRKNHVDGMPDLIGEFTLDRFIPEESLQKLYAGNILFTSDPAGQVGHAQDANPVRAQIVIPLIRQGKLIAALFIQQSQEREWTQQEIELAEETAERMQTMIERARTERDLRDSEKRFRILANTVPSLVWSTAPDGTVQYLNDSWLIYTGLTIEESISNWARLTIHPDDYERCLQAWQHSLATGEEYRLELRYRRYDGEYRWFQSHAVPARDENGNITAWQGVSTDIHERISRETELQEIINRTPFMLTRCTRDLHYRFVSNAYATLVGSTPREVQGRPIVEILGEKGFETILPYIQKVLQGERVEYESEVPIRGKTLIVHAVYIPDFDEQGRVIGWFASLMDVTSRKRMENELRESERKFSLIYEKLPFAAALSSPQDGTLVDVNEEFARTFGYSKQDVIGMTSAELGIHPDVEDRQRVLDEIRANGSARDIELKLVTKAKGPRIFLGNIDMVTINEEKYIFQTIQDITERRQLEEQLERNNQKLNEILTSIQDDFYVLDHDWKFVFTSRSFTSKVGKEPQDFIGNSIWEMFPKHVGSALYDNFHIAMEKREVRRFEIGGKYTPAWYRMTVFPSTEGITVLGTDITESKRTEAALLASEEKYRRIVEIANEGIWELDGEGRTTFVNPYIVKMLGYEADEMMGRDVLDFLPAEEHARTRDRMELERNGTPSRGAELRCRRKDGSLVWVIISTSPKFDAQGNFLGTVGMLSDITERKQYEESLIEYARRQTALYALADELNRTQSVQDVYDASLNAIINALQCDRASILLFDDSQRMRFVAWRGLSDAYRKATDGHSPWKYGEENPVVITYDAIDTSDLSGPLKAVIASEGIGSLAFIPIILQGKLIGKFMVYFNKPHTFRETELYLSLTIARQLASAIDRKQAEDALRESQQSLSLTYHHTAIGIVESSPDGTVIKANEEFCRMLGYTEQELLGVPISSFTHEEDRKNDLDLYLQLQRDESTFYRIEKRYIRKDGSFFWGEVVRSMVRDENGNALYAIGAVLDITERRQKEEALRARTEEIETLMEVSPIGIFVAHDAECRYITGNPAGYQLVEMTDDFHGNVSKSAPEPEQPTYRVFRGSVELAAEELPMQAAARLGMEIEEETLELRFINGTRKYIYAYAKPLFDVQGQSRGAIAAMLDITERKRSEDTLRARTEEIETLMEVTPIGIMVAHDPQCNVITGNPAAYALLEAPLDPAVNLSKPTLDQTGPSHRVFRDGVELAVEDLPLQKSARLGIEVEEETLELRFENGAKKYAYLYAKPLFDPQGKPRGTVAAMLDITERRKIEESLRLDATIMENVPAGVYMVRASDGCIVQTNPTFDKLFGYEPGEIIGNHVSTLNAPTERSPQEVAAGIIASLKEKGSWQGEVQSLKKDGTSFWTYASVTTFEHGAYGTVWVAARQDINENKKREQRIAEQARMLDLSYDAIIVRDLQDRITYWNQGAEQMYGWAPNEVLGKLSHDIFQTEHPVPIEEIKADLYRDGYWSGELHHIRRDHSHITTLSRWTLNRDPQGKPVSILETNNDITLRKQAENRLLLLTQVSDLTRRYEDPVELMSAVADAVGKHLHVTRALFSELDIQNEVEIVHRDYHDGVASVEGKHAVSEHAQKTAEEFRAGKTVVNTDSMIDPRTAAEYDRVNRNPGLRSYVYVPLMRDGHWVASMMVSDTQPRSWSPEDISLLETIAERTWTATEKLRIHAALRDSEERLRVTINTTAVGFATLDLDTRFVDVNQAYCDMVGYSREELFEKTSNSLTHPDYVTDNRNNIARLVAGEIASFVLEKPYIRKNGEQIWVQNSVSLLRDAEGDPLHLIVISQDVTERHRAEDELHQLNQQLEIRVQNRTAELQSAYEFLRESEATARLILESMPDAILVTGKDGNIVYANNQVENLFGYTPNEVLGQPVEYLIPKRFHEIHQEHRQLYHGNPERRYMGLEKELFGQRKDNSEFPVDVMLSPISNSTTWDVMINIRDNTLQKQNQEAIRANEEKLRKLFEILPVGISFLDNKGQITQMNATLTQIIGYSKQELQAGRFKTRRYIHSDGSPMELSEFASARAKREQKPVYNVETGIIKEDGEIIWTSVNAAPVSVADVDMVVATIDITERKRAEEALHKNRERLRILSRRLVEVQEEERRALAHELHDRVGQNLAALNLNLNILRSQLSAEALQVIGTRIDDSVSLVNQILNITRSVMADLRSNVLDDYGLEAALREYADRFTQRTGVQVITNKPGNVVPRFDPGVEMTLLRIAQEALTNVSRHAQANLVNISIDADPESINMSIEDNGIGILSWQKANQPGSHGLRIIRERAEAFGGSLLVHSSYKKGTRIEVKIPLGNSGSLKNLREKHS